MSEKPTQKKGGAMWMMDVRDLLVATNPLRLETKDELLRHARRPMNPFAECEHCQRLKHGLINSQLAYCAHCQTPSTLLKDGQQIARVEADGQLWLCLRQAVLLDSQKRATEHDPSIGLAGGFELTLSCDYRLAEAYRAAKQGRLLAWISNRTWRVIVDAKPMPVEVFQPQPPTQPQAKPRKQRKPKNEPATTAAH